MTPTRVWRAGKLMRADEGRPREGPPPPVFLEDRIGPMLPGVGIGCLPLLLVGILVAIDDGRAFNDPVYQATLPLFTAALWLFGAVVVATPVCLLVRRLRPIGWGLLFAVLVTLVAAYLAYRWVVSNMR